MRDAPTPEARQQAAAETIVHFQAKYPRAMSRFAEDLETIPAPLRVPPARRKFVRATNLIERAFEEQRRRTQIIPRFLEERSCLKPGYAAGLQRPAERQQRLRISKLRHRTG